MSSDPFEVSITQCNICGTLSTHWGSEVEGSCLRCSDTASMINDFLDSDPDLRADLDKLKSMDDVQPLAFDMKMFDFLDNKDPGKLDISSNNGNEPWNHDPMNPSLSEVNNIDENQLELYTEKGSKLMQEVMTLDEVNQFVPLLRSIYGTFEEKWKEVTSLLLDVNSYLSEPDPHWSYLAQLEQKKEVIESVVETLNSYISECHLFGCDLVNPNDGVYCVIARVPEYWFEGKDDLNESDAALFYFDGGLSFNTFTSLSGSHIFRREINRDDVDPNSPGNLGA
jgi:hypothetical protein